MERHLKMKQFELLYNALGVMAAELADVGDSFHQGKQCSKHAQIESNQICVCSFSRECLIPRGLAICATHKMNLEIEKCEFSSFSGKHMDKTTKKALASPFT